MKYTTELVESKLVTVDVDISVLLTELLSDKLRTIPNKGARGSYNTINDKFVVERVYKIEGYNHGHYEKETEYRSTIITKEVKPKLLQLLIAYKTILIDINS